MKWSHLPVAGGIYDQHPELLSQWQYIFHKRAEYDEAQRKKEERTMGKQKAPSPVAGRRRRR
jgi:hypothetical protein